MLEYQDLSNITQFFYKKFSLYKNIIKMSIEITHVYDTKKFKLNKNTHQLILENEIYHTNCILVVFLFPDDSEIIFCFSLESELYRGTTEYLTKEIIQEEDKYNTCLVSSLEDSINDFYSKIESSYIKRYFKLIHNVKNF